MRDETTPSAGAGGEDELRILLRGAVEGLEPSEGALERLRCAVPARRARRRRALIGAAAAVLIAGGAVPAGLHLADGGDPDADRPAMAGHGTHTGDEAGPGSSDPHQNGFGSYPKATGSPVPPTAGGATGQPDTPPGGLPSGGLTVGPSAGIPGTSAATGGSVVGPLPSVAAPGVPGCGAEQLGVVGFARAPETDGKVYGGFRVTNVSGQGCAVAGRDAVTAASASSASLAPGPSVAVVGHTSGDPASGLLGDTSSESPVVVLPPNKSYEVRFAWVPPGEPCTAAADTGGKPSQSGSEGTSGALGSGVASDPQSGAGPAPTNVEVSHTPQTVGGPTTRATILDACGGTVYRTGAIPLAD
ncbi:hypothetical protein AB0O18_09575 [Streptomyces sp. NPDC093224]|uniref:hypothetical protein n=1 Tax=Streptomyces sp. NPDC093224 TaxID=3155198 RepID=UPI00342D7822